MPDPTKPLKISDKKEFEYRNQMYNDSLAAYNESMKMLSQEFEPLSSHNRMPIEEIEDLKFAVNNKISGHPSGTLDVLYDNTLDKNKWAGYEGNRNIKPTVVLEGRGGAIGYEFYKKPTQPVEYDPRDTYQQIPTKQPVITPIQQSLDEELRTAVVPDAIEYPKDVQRFTAGNYLESQGKPSGYVNYGDNTGRKEMYQDGGIRNINNNDIGFLFNEKFGI